MKPILKTIAALLLVAVVAGAITFFFFPQIIIAATNARNAGAANLERRTVLLDDYMVHYYQSEKMTKAQTVVLVHGMGDDKNSFVRSSELLAEHYNLVLPDLSGHGENARVKGRDYSIAGQVQFLDDLLKVLDLEKVYLVGNSMGGHTSAAYAIKYPEKVAGLVLVNAPGVRLDDHVVYGGFGAPLKEAADLDTLLARVFYQPPSLPGPVARRMMEEVNASMDFVNNDLVSAITEGADFDLKDRVRHIEAPTLVLWGKHDRVVKFNVAQYYAAHIPLARLELLNDGAHSPQLEIPDAVATAIHDFIEQPKLDMLQATQPIHAAKVQYYRWYQLYEGELSAARIDNQLDILAEDVVIKSAAGEMRGRADYPARLEAYRGWQNAHHVQQVTVNEQADGHTNLEADIIYQNVKPDGTQSAYTIHYSTHLEDKGGVLPKFTRLELTPTGELPARPFEPAYAENRLRSLMYYWLFNMERLDGNAAPFAEILAPDFTLTFSTAAVPITTLAQLETWLQGTPGELELSTHRAENFNATVTGPNTYRLNVDFKWRGITKNGKGLQAVTSHEWQVVDDPAERFARIQSARVTQREPLGPLAL